MLFLSGVFQAVQLLLALILITSVLLQVRNAGLGSGFGQSDSFFNTRRGADKLLFNFTIVIAVSFFLISVATVRLAGINPG